MENKIKTLLCELGVCTEQSITDFYPNVRDRDDVSVLICKKSGVIFLSTSDHMDFSHYVEKNDFNYWGTGDRKSAVACGHEDDHRRFRQFENIIVNKKWMDIGTGAGGILDLLSPISSETLAVEPQQSVREYLVKLGYNTYCTVDDVPDNDIEVATMFHVFEHLIDPINTLKVLKNKMAIGGKIIIEVPHAKDFLLSLLDLETFKAFTFWSEHLILHTRESLRVFLEKGGFSNVTVKGYQRYPLANHLHWLAKGKPAGHIIWDHLRTVMLDTEYENMLAQIDLTDTLIATAVIE